VPSSPKRSGTIRTASPPGSFHLERAARLDEFDPARAGVSPERSTEPVAPPPRA
jgi:hypothetical protein